MAYTTQANLEAKLNGTSLTSAQVTYFDEVLSGAVDAYIDSQTGTTFGSTATAQVYVGGDDSMFLTIPTMHDITAVSKVEDDGTETAIAVDEYSTYPRGEANKYALRRTSGDWEDGIENYKISGKLGFVEIPDDIVMVATELALNALNESDNNVESEKVGDWSVKYAVSENSISAESKSVLSSYRRLSRGM